MTKDQTIPEEIWAGEYDEETLSVTAYDHAVSDFVKYHADSKVTELEAMNKFLGKKVSDLEQRIKAEVTHSGHVKTENAKLRAKVAAAEGLMEQISIMQDAIANNGIKSYPIRNGQTLWDFHNEWSYHAEQALKTYDEVG